MWIELKNGELFNLDYAEKIYMYQLKSGLYGIAIHKRRCTISHDIEILRYLDGLSEAEAKYELEILLQDLNT